MYNWGRGVAVLVDGSLVKRFVFSEYFPRFSLSAVQLMLPISFLNINFSVDLFVSILAV
jgi:hypothetical protein